MTDDVAHNTNDEPEQIASHRRRMAGQAVTPEFRCCARRHRGALDRRVRHTKHGGRLPLPGLRGEAVDSVTKVRQPCGWPSIDDANPAP
jgi:hypothetical protein